MSRNSLYFPPPPSQQQQQQQHYENTQQYYNQPHHSTLLPPPPSIPPPSQQQQQRSWTPRPVSPSPSMQQYNPATLNPQQSTQSYNPASYNPATYNVASYNPSIYNVQSNTQYHPEPLKQQQEQQNHTAQVQLPTQYSADKPSIHGSVGSASHTSAGYFHPPPQFTRQPVPAIYDSQAPPISPLEPSEESLQAGSFPSPHITPPLPPSNTGTHAENPAGYFPAPTQNEESFVQETIVEEVVGKPLVVQEVVTEKDEEVEVFYAELPAEEALASPTISEQQASTVQSLSPLSSFAGDEIQSVTTLCLSEHDKQEFDELSMEQPGQRYPPPQQGDMKERESVQAGPYDRDSYIQTSAPPAMKPLEAKEDSEKREQFLPTKANVASSAPLEDKFNTMSLTSQDPPPPYSLNAEQSSSISQHEPPAVTKQSTVSQIPVQQPASTYPVQQPPQSHFPIHQPPPTQLPIQQYPPAPLPIQQSTTSPWPVQQSTAPPVFLQQSTTPQFSVQQTVPQPYIPPVPALPARPSLPQRDTHQSGKVKRFLGDTLVGRVARSTVTTATSTVKAPSVLSPWGDNNPVTLPNVRYRDAILFGTFAVVGAPLVDGASDLVTNSLGADNFIAEIVSSGAGFVTGTTVVKYGVFQLVEQGIDKAGLERIIKEKQGMTRTMCCLTILASIRHKLLDMKAELKFDSQYPTRNQWDCAKGWFVPYIFATCRIALIPRASDFGMAELRGPGLCADSSLAHTLINKIPNIIPLCDPSPEARNLPYARILVTFLGITPFRADMWSTSRRPGCAQIKFHLLDGCPGLVIPVPLPAAHAGTAPVYGMPQGSPASSAPVLAWSPWTLRQMLTYQQRQQGLSAQQTAGFGGFVPPSPPSSPYTASQHYNELCSWILKAVDRSGLDPKITYAGENAFERVLGAAVGWIINGALGAVTAMGGKDGKVFGTIDPDRAGVVALRY